MKRVLEQIWKILTKEQRRGILLLLAASLYLNFRNGSRFWNPFL